MAPEDVKQDMRAIERSVIIRSGADEIFDVLIRPEELVKWFPEKATTDPEVGGVFEFSWDNLKIWVHKRGIYTDIVPGTLLSFTWPVGNLNQYTIVSFYIYAQDNYTTVIFCHSDFGYGEDWDREYEQHSAMWTFFLENLKDYIEEGIDRRQELSLETTAE